MNAIEKLINSYTNEILAYLIDGEYKYISVKRDLFEIDLPYICDENNEIWMPVKQVCNELKLTKSQTHTEINRMKRDIFLKLESKIIPVVYSLKNENILNSNTVCVHADSFLVWILKMDIMSYNDYAYNVLSKIINKALKSNIYPEIKPIQDSKFHKEKVLQNEIIKEGHINDIKITNSEVRYDFGRIDLLGKDSVGNSVCIELKKDNEFENTKEQLLRYRNSNIFDRIIYIAYSINSEMKKFLIENNIKYLIYTISKTGKIEYSK